MSKKDVKDKEKKQPEKEDEIKNEENSEEQETKEKEENVETEKEPDETESLKAQVNQLNDKYLRLFAEFDNYKRRTQKEKDSTYDLAVSNTINDIIPVLDTLELSMKNETGDVNDYRKGIELVIKKFNDSLEKLGVVPIDAVSKPFDPQFHNAVMNSEEGDGESGTVLEEFQKGYMLHDKVIRHSMVKVKA